MKNTEKEKDAVQKIHCNECKHYRRCPKMAGIPFCYGTAGKPSDEVQTMLEEFNKKNTADQA